MSLSTTARPAGVGTIGGGAAGSSVPDTAPSLAGVAFLRAAADSGRLGGGPREPSDAQISTLRTLLSTVPWLALLFQLLWSCGVVGVAYAFGGRTTSNSLSVAFWSSRVPFSGAVQAAVGWAVFVLLAFFITEASYRFRESQVAMNHIRAALLRITRQIVMHCRKGTWHDGDLNRLEAHLVAYTVALKMQLRQERDIEQLLPILDERDAADVLAAHDMYAHCSRVVRAYISVSEDDGKYGFQHIPATKAPIGPATRFFLIPMLDEIDGNAAHVDCINRYRPAAGYLNHLNIFLYIWLMLLPLSLVETSGWFTPFWALLITYGVATMYSIALALYEPFGYDVQDLKVNRLAADTGVAVYELFQQNLATTALVRPDHQTPPWLDAPPPPCKTSELVTDPLPSRPFLDRLFSISRVALLGVATLMLWTLFIVLGTWRLSRGQTEPSSVRWWSFYIPLSGETATLVSLALFTLFGFWLKDAYARYYRGLVIWQKYFRASLEDVSFCLSLHAGGALWHKRDRDRIISFFAVLPYVAKQQLRDSRDLSGVRELLDDVDFAALQAAPDHMEYVFHVLYAYFGGSERGDASALDGVNPYTASNYKIFIYLVGLEQAFVECQTLRMFPISPSFTLHMRLFTVFWLMILPLTLVENDGFISLAFVVLIGYSIINLLVVGDKLTDPFGTDEEDIPADVFCREIRDSLHNSFHESPHGFSSYVREEPYDRATLVPKTVSRAKVSTTKALPLPAGVADRNRSAPTWKLLFKKLTKHLPTVSVAYVLLATAWTVAAVFASWGLSKAWPEAKRDSCHAWCSPSDIDGKVLANVGYALFLILAFRASDSLNRYQDGIDLLYEMEKLVRNISMEMTEIFKSGFFHEHDKERIVAHLAQVPLELRDMLLKIHRDNPDGKEGLLSDGDRQRLEASSNKLDHLIQTVESYVLLQDSTIRDGFSNMSDFRCPIYMLCNLLTRFHELRGVVAHACVIKRFPVVRMYTSHQQVFTAFWLALLPLSMTAQTGFFTILWVPLIAYGVLAMESIAILLVDPFGDDSVDIPVNEFCTRISHSVIEMVNSSKWDVHHHTTSSLVDNQARIGTLISGREATAEYPLPRLDMSCSKHDAAETRSYGDQPIDEFHLPRNEMLKPSLLAHLMKSVPWWSLVAVTSWTVFACVISYLSRDRRETNVRWWKSTVSIDKNVAQYLSFAAFTLLGFFVNAAFERYNRGGSVWGGKLRLLCHTLAVDLRLYFIPGSIHDGDTERAVAHVAALPLVLNHQLRGTRDLRKLRGILSDRDIARIACAEDMSAHCIEVLRAYLYRVRCHGDGHLTKQLEFLNRDAPIGLVINELDGAVRTCRSLLEFEIAPGFTVLLNAMLGLWFALLPFVLAELSGWFTIVWVPLIAYGLLGMHTVASELQYPFGTDLNDLDLDELSKRIVEDVLHVQHNTRGIETFVHPSSSAKIWDEKDSSHSTIEDIAGVAIPDIECKSHEDSNSTPLASRIRTSFSLAVHAMPAWVAFGSVAWSGTAVVGAWGVGKWFIVPDCDSKWFCSYIALSDSVTEYVGFALFLLLGFRLVDSHNRFMSGIKNWHDDILVTLRTLSNRIFQTCKPSMWHTGDRERIASHLAAFPIALKATLRGEDCSGELQNILSAEDLQLLLLSNHKADYCLDVVRAYIFDIERIMTESPDQRTVSGNEDWWLNYYSVILTQLAMKSVTIVRIPLPYGYVTHLRIFLVIWLVILPFGLVESTGWVTILWTQFIAYGIVGVERWAAELSDPFGYDISDIPLAELSKEVVSAVLENYTQLKNGPLALLRLESTS